MSLNSIQKNAIHCTNGPCLILAGAGSGKTKVIINKIIHLIKNCQYQPENIVAVTFTNKAAHEIKIRLAKYLNAIHIKNMIISTFHSLGLEIIRKEIKSFDLDINFCIFDEKDQLSLLKTIIDKKIEYNKKFLKKILFMISYWKNNFFTPEAAKISAKSTLEQECALLYKKYNWHLRQSNALDFDDLICIPVLLLKNNKKIRNDWKKKISYFLVDEYQDTNNSQYALLKILTNENSNFTLVGDDDQSIYSWRGAKLENILSLQKDYPNLRIIKMEQNYRSSKRIIKVANSLISNNVNYFQKKLFSNLDYGKKITIIIGDNEEQEAEKIVEKIIYEKSKKKMHYKDCAILYRGNYQAQIFEKIFIKKNIPYNISISTSFFSRPEIKDILSYLRIIINPNDDYAFIRILNIPSRKMGVITLQKIKKIALEKNISLFTVIKNLKEHHLFNTNTLKKLNSFSSWIEKKYLISSSNPLKILNTIIEDIEYESWLSKTLKEPEKIKISMNNIYVLLKWCKSMLKGSEIEIPMTLSQIIAKMTLRDIVEENKESDINDTVKLMTLHASKGLEFSFVFIIGMIDGILPNYRSINDNKIEEERRLTYVGITRAKNKLFLSLCRKRNEYGKWLDAEPSRFLFELPREDLYFEENLSLNKKYNTINIQKNKIKTFKKILQNFKKKYQ
ncbi:UvrD-helicase domain-containing protein [Buchnera aphidicola]|uniref:UvrD-helicase domain-containing protein n=1 Tax=Buchnera aphidicola TaxID=9 RepID=UPI0034641FF4